MKDNFVELIILINKKINNNTKKYDKNKIE